MSPEENHEEVAHRLERIESEYPPFEVEEVSYECDPAEWAELDTEYVGSAYAWVVRRAAEAPELTPSMPDDAAPDGDRVLMILGRGANAWGLPGGGVEGDESYEEAAVREVEEETGIRCSLGDPWGLRRARWVQTEGDAERHSLHVFYDGRYEGGQLRVQGGELNGAAWFEKPPARMHPANERRAETWFDEDD